MNLADTHNDIKEVNLAYLMLAQNMVRADRPGAFSGSALATKLPISWIA